MNDDISPKPIYLKDYEAPVFLIDKTELDFNLHDSKTVVKSRLTMRQNPEAKSNATRSLVLNGGEDIVLRSITLEGKVLNESDYQLSSELLELEIKFDSFVLEIETEIQPHNNTRLEGLYQSNGMYCTQCEAEGFRHITYYLDRPDVMSKFTTRIEADKKAYPILLSNGNKMACGDLTGDRHWVSWEDPFKKPCYLFALVAGDLAVKEDHFTTMSGRDVLLQLFVESDDLDKCDHALLSLKNAMKWDEDVYGREYDLDIYMIVAVSHFNMGAMENKGLNIFNTSCVLANPETTTDAAFQRVGGVVAHEYFHNWSGNRVTCRDWFQLSLKEGFTVFRDEEFSADMGSRTVKRIEDVTYLRTVQFAEDAGPLAHPIRPESYIEMNNFYTTTVYNKGAEVVRMIHTIVGAEGFRRGSDLYFERFDGQAVTTDDFVSAMEEANSADLAQFRRWYTQAGTPHLSLSDHYDAQAEVYTLHVKQNTKPTPNQQHKDPFFIPLRMSLLDENGNTLAHSLESGSPLDLPQLDKHERVLIVDQSEQDYVFKGVKTNPTPSLLRRFSA
ncbi:MAG: aminopeptidase N, partial [Pseudomonadales bacterium]|nr:aminopeptidase N [Pseudomonadales bacterium]